MRKVASLDNDSQPFPWILVLLNPKLRDLGKEYPLYGWLRTRQRSQSSMWKPIVGSFLGLIYFVASIFLTFILMDWGEYFNSAALRYMSYCVIPVGILSSIFFCWWLTRPRHKSFFPSTTRELLHHLKTKGSDPSIAAAPIDPIYLHVILYFERIRSKIKMILGYQTIAAIIFLGTMDPTSTSITYYLLCFSLFPPALIGICFILSRCILNYEWSIHQEALCLKNAAGANGSGKMSVPRWRRRSFGFLRFASFWLLMVINMILLGNVEYFVFFLILGYHLILALMVYVEFREKRVDQASYSQSTEELRQDFADLIARNQEPLS